jgi:hypothetical protein
VSTEVNKCKSSKKGSKKSKKWKTANHIN